MLTKLINKFQQADGRSEFVIAVVVDIRDFSGFSKNHEAPDIAMFIKKFYAAMLKDYFTEATYAKPTGDGLLMLFTYSEKNLSTVSEHVISNCLKAVNDFPQMLASDPMLNYSIPNRIGFGIARGTAFCLYAGKEIIDYSGQVLNLASRLNDFARPKGVVIDGAYMIGVIPEEFRSLFTKDENVFIRGIAETTSTSIYHSKDVSVSESTRTPISLDVWEKTEKVLKFSDIKLLSGNYFISLPKTPVSKEKISARAIWPNKKILGHVKYYSIDVSSYTNDANGPKVNVSLEKLKDHLKNQKITNNVDITLEVQFVAKT
ncbi:MAG: hypothetical protein Q8K61_09920 [Gallionella sp.]|nr:hypothetical protein [Gallionella sp.]